MLLLTTGYMYVATEMGISHVYLLLTTILVGIVTYIFPIKVFYPESLSELLWLLKGNK